MHYSSAGPTFRRRCRGRILACLALNEGTARGVIGGIERFRAHRLGWQRQHQVKGPEDLCIVTKTLILTLAFACNDGSLSTGAGLGVAGAYRDEEDGMRMGMDMLWFKSALPCIT